MKQAIKLFILVSLAALLLPTVSMAANMGDGLQCPSDWQRTKKMSPLISFSYLLKQCRPHTNDAIIELYATRTSSNSMITELDRWTQDLRRRGLPYQKLLNEQPGHVSGYPAVLRTFSGWDRDGKWYDSYLVVSRYKGTNYVFVGFSMKGHDRVRIQVRNAMNNWYFPGVSGHTNNLPGPDPVISQNNNPNTTVNINPTVNVNRPGCTRQTSQSSTYTNTINDSGNSYSNTQDTDYSNSGNTYQNKPDTKPDSKPDNSNNNQNSDRPSDNKYLDYILE